MDICRRYLAAYKLKNVLSSHVERKVLEAALFGVSAIPLLCTFSLPTKKIKILLDEKRKYQEYPYLKKTGAEWIKFDGESVGTVVG